MKIETIIALCAGLSSLSVILIAIGAFLGDLRHKFMSRSECLENRKSTTDNIKKIENVQEHRIKEMHERIDTVLEAIKNLSVDIAGIKGQLN